MRDLRRFRFSLLLAALVLMFLALPYVRSTFLGEQAVVLLTSLVMLAGLFAAARSWKSLALGLALAVPAVALDLAALAYPGHGFGMAGNTVALGYFAYLIFHMTKEVFLARSVHLDLLFGAVCIYLVLAVGWTSLYLLVEAANPDSFAPAPSAAHPKLELLYFSFTALTTVGYGDVVPVSYEARSLASIQSAVGVLYPAILVASLVGRLRLDGEG